MRELFKTGTSLFFRRQTSILSAAFVIMATYGAAHLIGLLKTRLLLSVFFGSTSSLLDVYYAAFVIPDTLFQLLVIGSLSAAFIPVFSRLLVKKEDEAWYVAGVSLNLVLSCFFIFSLSVFIFAPQLSGLIAPGFDSSQLATMSSLLRVMLAAQLFFCVSGFLTGIIQSHQRFLIPALAPIAYNLGIIFGTLVLSPFMGIFGPAVGVVIGAALHMLIQLPFALKLGFRFVPVFSFTHPGIREIVRLLPPRALALGIDQVEQFIAVILSSLLPSGSLTLFNVARLLYALPMSLFGVTIGQAALPTLSRLAAEGDRKTFRQTLMDSLLQIAFLTLPASVLFIVLRVPIVRIVFGAKSFPWSATLLTGKILAALCFSVTFASLMQLLIRAFYALHDTKTPLFVGVFGAIFDVVFGILLVKVFNLGPLGLAVAISLTAVVETLILFTLIIPKIDADTWTTARFIASFLKITITGLITGFSLWIPMRLLDRFVFDTTRTFPLILLTLLTSFIGLLAYLIFSYYFRVEQLKTFELLIKRVTNLKTILLPHSKEPLIVPAPDQN
jgi:putative peptidoglycan lipid II flippase